MDLGILLVDRVLSESWLREHVQVEDRRVSKRIRPLVQNWEFCLRTIGSVMRFLRNQDLTLQHRFARPDFWPWPQRLPKDDDLEWSYGTAGTMDQARLLCTLFLEDVCQLIRELIDPHFELVRYAEKLCMSLPTFDPVEQEIGRRTALTDTMLELFEAELQRVKPDMVGYSVPFPGNLLAALQCAAYVKEKYPEIHQNMGGGYVNTELRQLRDARLFRYIDSLCFDDGELPMLRLCEGGELVRTIVRNEEKGLRIEEKGLRIEEKGLRNEEKGKRRKEKGEILNEEGGLRMEEIGMESRENVPFGELPAPTLDGLPLELYLDTADTANPMQRLWSNGRWNKMMLAHGCYWHKCSFCDTSLDYIGRFSQPKAQQVVDRMESMIRETGETGFHFVDEAAPPALLRGVAEEILKRGLTVSYWTNIRFEKSFDAELCYLLARSGCIAVSGGLEVASERVLKLINKGVSVAGVTETLKHFRQHGIMVHAYLMYGFPTQTVNELVESLDTVRHLFAEGLIASAFWHRYAMTCHSPSGLHPETVGARHTDTEPAPFANNEIGYTVPHDPDWSRYTEGLNLATYNFMRGAGFDTPARKWLHI